MAVLKRMASGNRDGKIKLILQPDAIMYRLAGSERSLSRLFLWRFTEFVINSGTRIGWSFSDGYFWTCPPGLWRKKYTWPDSITSRLVEQRRLQQVFRGTLRRGDSLFRGGTWDPNQGAIYLYFSNPCSTQEFARSRLSYLWVGYWWSFATRVSGNWHYGFYG